MHKELLPPTPAKPVAMGLLRALHSMSDREADASHAAIEAANRARRENARLNLINNQ